MTETETQHYVEYFFEGDFGTETTVEEISSRDPESVEIEDDVYAFRFFDTELDESELEDEEIVEERRNVSGKFYPDAEVISGAEIMDNQDEYGEGLARRVWQKAAMEMVRTRLGNYQPFDEEDEVL